MKINQLKLKFYTKNPARYLIPTWKSYQSPYIVLIYVLVNKIAFSLYHSGPETGEELLTRFNSLFAYKQVDNNCINNKREIQKRLNFFFANVYIETMNVNVIKLYLIF